MYESSVKSTPAAISRALHRHAPEAERIGIEVGASSSWLCRQLRESGHPIVHMESRHAHRALSMRLTSTNANAPTIMIAERGAALVKSAARQRLAA